jgi:Mg2+ and Co2+ transporter CorA
MRNSSVKVALALLLLFSCEEGYITDCDECDPDGINQPQLMIYIRNSEYEPTNPLVTIYEGAIEDSIVLKRINVDVSYSYITYDAVLFKDYTVTLEFFLNSVKYVAIGAAYPKVRYDEKTCDEPCYYLYDNIIDLRLRYH